MDNFKAIYRILKALEAAMDCDEFDIMAFPILCASVLGNPCQ